MMLGGVVFQKVSTLEGVKLFLQVGIIPLNIVEQDSTPDMKKYNSSGNYIYKLSVYFISESFPVLKGIVVKWENLF